MTSPISMTSKSTDGNKRVCGFTLVELLLVLVLIAISMATIMPRFSGSIPGWQVRESSQNMLATIRLAQQFALTRQEIVAFVLDADSGSFAIRCISDSVDLGSKSNDFLVPRQFLGKDVKIVKLAGFKQIGNKKGLVFWPDGRTEAASVTLTGSKDSKTAEWHILVENDGSTVLQELFRNE